LGAIGAPGLRNACGLLNSHAMPTFGEECLKDRGMKFIGVFLSTNIYT
jgi:hypothetical protein